MTDKLPADWPDYYVPSSTEWRGGFADILTKANAAAAAAVSAASATNAANLTQLSSTLNSTITTATADMAHNPAVADLAMGNHKVTGLATGTALTDAVRLDQVGEQLLGRVTAVAGVGAVALAFPAGYIRYKLGWSVACPGSAGVLALRFSKDGTTFDSGNFYYYTTSENRSTTQTTVYTGNPTANLIQLNGISSANQIQNGTYDFGASGYGMVHNSITDYNGAYYNSGAAIYTGGSPVRAVLLTHTSGGLFNGGEFWMTGIPG